MRRPKIRRKTRVELLGGSKAKNTALLHFTKISWARSDVGFAWPEAALENNISCVLKVRLSSLLS